MLHFPDIVKYFTGIFMFKAFQNTLPSSLQYLLTLASSQCCKTSGYKFYFYQKYVSTTKKTVLHLILMGRTLEFI